MLNELLNFISGVAGFAGLAAGMILSDIEVFKCGLLLLIISAIYGK